MEQAKKNNQSSTLFFFLGISVIPKTLQGSVIFLHRDEPAHLEKATGASQAICYVAQISKSQRLKCSSGYTDPPKALLV